MFHYYTIKEIYEYAEKMGYKSEDVKIERDEDNKYEVSFGYDYTETWTWYFDSLDAPATDYEHAVWKD